MRGFLLTVAVVTLAAFISAVRYSAVTSEPAARRLMGERERAPATPELESLFADFNTLVETDTTPLVPCGCFGLVRADEGAPSVAVKPKQSDSGNFTRPIWSE